MTARTTFWIHGWGTSPAVWGDVDGYFPERNHTFYTYAQCDTAGQMRDALRAQLLREEAGSVDVVGWSMGAMLAIQAAAEPNIADRIRTLTVLSGTLRFVSSDRSAGWPPRAVERMRTALRGEPDETLRRFASGMFAAGESDVPEVRQWLLDASGHTDFTASGLEAGLVYLQQADLRACWPSVRQQQPVMWLHGRRDTICPPGARPDDAAHGEWFPEGGHALMLSHKEQVYERLRRFWHDHR